jgi:hypothetical protein
MNFEICVIYLSVSLLCYFFGVVAIKKAFEREGTKYHVLPKVKNGAIQVVGIDFAMVGHSSHEEEAIEMIQSMCFTCNNIIYIPFISPFVH